MAQTAQEVLGGISNDRPHYLVFLASHDPGERGRAWCRDCRASEPVIAKYIQPHESTIVWVGSREEWNDPASPWRAQPFHVERVPTLIKVQPGEGDVSARVASASKDKIVEAQILEGSVLKAFLAS